MINKKHLREIMKTVLRGMGSSDLSIDKLVLGTMMHMSGLENMYEGIWKNPSKVGLMMMDREKFDYIINNFIKYRVKQSNLIFDLVGVDLVETDADEIWREATWNIALMVVLTYLWYSSQYPEIPEDDNASVTKCFINEWDTKAEHKYTDFINTLEEMLN